MNTLKKAALAGILVAAASVNTAMADVYYEVGSGQTYGTIDAALRAVPTNTFVENHIVQIHGGTYTEYNKDTDPTSKLNGKVSPTSKTNRLILQAYPGDNVIWNATNGVALNIRHSHVTVQGLKFTGMTSLNGYYLNIDNGGYGTPNRLRGGVIVQNCEFEGMRGLKRGDNTSYNGLEPGVDFSHAFLFNYVHDFDCHTEIPGYCEKPVFHGGNLYARWGGLNGGMSFFYPRSGTNTVGDTYQTRWYLNNTLYTTNGNLAGALRTETTNASNVVFANNILHWGSTNINQFYMYCATQPSSGLWPTLSRNLLYKDKAIDWGKITSVSYSTLTAWSNQVVATGGALIDHLENNPYFVSAVTSDFRLDGVTQPNPAVNKADQSHWNSAMTTLGISNLLGYWNPARDMGYYRPGPPPHLGAMKAITPPQGTSISIR